MALIPRKGVLLGGGILLAAVMRRRRTQSDPVTAPAWPEPAPAAEAQAEASETQTAPEQPAPAPEPRASAPEPPDDDALVAQEEAAAAAAAARIGGSVGSETGDPAMDPVYEAGGGEQDGWEAAETELIENASHGEGHANPQRDAFTPERESDRAGAVYGEADEVISTESVEDERSAPEDDAG